MGSLRYLGVRASCGWNGVAYVGGDAIKIGSGGVRIARLVNCVSYLNGNRTPIPMLRMRGVIRKIHSIDFNSEGQKGGRLFLNALIKKTGDSAVRKLAIWLRGRLGGKRGVKIISEFKNDPDWRVRKEVARAIKRLNGWHVLREMSENDPHVRVRFHATQRPLRPFDKRLESFLDGVQPNEIDDLELHELFLDNSVSLPCMNPPKSTWSLRRILDRMYA